MFPFVGYEFHLDLALVIPLREMAQFSGFDPTLKVKYVFYLFLISGCLMSLIGLLAAMEKIVPEGPLHISSLSVSACGPVQGGIDFIFF